MISVLVLCLATATQIRAQSPEVRDTFGAVRGLVIDVDGVLRTWDRLIPGAEEFMLWINEHNINHVFLTDGTSTGEQLSESMSKAPFAISARIDPQRVYSAGLAMGRFLNSGNHLPRASHVLVLGCEYVVKGQVKSDPMTTLRRLVSPSVFASWTVRQNLTSDEALQWAESARVDHIKLAVILIPGDGYMKFSSELGMAATILLRNGASLLVLNRISVDRPPADPMFPQVNYVVPYSAPYEAFLANAAGFVSGSVRAETRHFNFGKGGSRIFSHALAMLNEKRLLAPTEDSTPSSPPLDRTELRPDQVIVIGDDLLADILPAQQLGYKTIFVTSGANTVLDAADLGITPDLIVSGVGELTRLFQSGFAAAAARVRDPQHSHSAFRLPSILPHPKQT